MLFTTRFSDEEFAGLKSLAADMGDADLGDVVRAAVAAFKPPAKAGSKPAEPVEAPAAGGEAAAPETPHAEA